jgi:feruloyl-CoA synthase
VTEQTTARAFQSKRALQGLRSRHQLGHYARCVGEYLEYWAREAPNRAFLLERSADGAWQGPSYGQALEQVYRVGSALLARKLSAERPVAVLSENSVEHALLMLACLHVGIPIAPISPAYSLVSRDFVKLKAIIQALQPGLLYVSDAARFAPALSALQGLHDADVVAGKNESAVAGGLAFDSLTSTRDFGAVDRAFSAITPDTTAKLLFTSGSMGEPKGVINTHRMLCSNQQAIAQIWPFLDDPPVLVDWLPWHHTFGGNHNFNMVLRSGGTLHLDGGRPLPGQFEVTLDNLREVAPTLVLNVPRALDMLAAALESDAALCAHFFSRLRLIFYAGAALPQHVWERLQALSLSALGREVPMISSWGLTESAPAATTCHFLPGRAGVIGLPIPACELKLVQSGDKLEARFRGPNVTPGYFKRPDLTANAFDDEGFFKTGDAVRFVDADRPERGLLFDGRVGEDFKLSTATWVSVGSLRLLAIGALAPVAQDVVVTGHDRDEVGLLIFPDVAACRTLCPDLEANAQPARLLRHPLIRARVEAGLSALDKPGSGSSTCIRRALLMSEPPSIDAGEITDKGYVNQRAVLTRRKALVEALYQNPPSEDVVTLPPRTAPLASPSRREP